MLAPLANGTAEQVAAALQPRPEDYDAVFADAETAAAARAGYASLWESPPRGMAKAGQSEVRAYAVLAEALRTENEQSTGFASEQRERAIQEWPGGYRKIAHKLNPERVWLRFKFVSPGQSSGMAYDGLVRIGDHWAWFPKPWRVLDVDGDA
jgi:hypothetical protein